MNTIFRLGNFMEIDCLGNIKVLREYYCDRYQKNEVR
jgi:hypothetical protein